MFITYYLQPVYTAATRLVEASVSIQHFNHETFTSVLDTFFEECLDFIGRFTVG